MPQTVRTNQIQATIAVEYAEQLHNWSGLTIYELEDNVDRTLSRLTLQLGTGRIGNT
jgi:hypothetical protein